MQSSETLRFPFKEKAGFAGLIRSSVFDIQGGRAARLEKELEHHSAGYAQAIRPLLEIDALAARMRADGIPDAFVEWKESDIGKQAIAIAEAQREAHFAQHNDIVAVMREAYLVAEKEDENLICTNGRAAVAGRLANITTYTGIINYGAVGTSTTDPAVSDTQLGTEIARTTVATSSQSTSTAYINFLFNMASFNGTAYEFGTFIDGSGTVNTGRIWTHLEPVGGWAKSNLQSMVVACTYPLTYVP